MEKMPDSVEELMKKSEKNLETLVSSREHCEEITEKIRNTINKGLALNDISFILALEDEFRELEKDSLFYYSAETRKIRIILRIIEIEQKRGGEISFLSSLNSYGELMERYLSTVLFLRRIEQNFESELIEEAQMFLQSIPISIYAATILFNEELFENYENYYWGLYQCMKSLWSELEKRSWLESMINRICSESPKVP